MKKYEQVLGIKGSHDLEFMDDLFEIKDLLYYMGIEVTLKQAHELWCEFSRDVYTGGFMDFISCKEQFAEWVMEDV